MFFIVFLYDTGLKKIFDIKKSSDKVDVGPVKENIFIKWKTFPLTDVKSSPSHLKEWTSV